MKTSFFLSLLLVTLSAASQSSLVTANKCYDEKSYGCAVDNYKKSVTEKNYQEKDYATILFRIGYGLKQLGNIEEAIKYLKDALVAKPGYGDAYWTLAGSYYLAEEYLSASENYGKAIDQFKDDPANLKSLYYWRGRSYDAIDKFEDALTYYDLAIKIDSTSGDYYAAAGDAAYNSKKYERASKYYLKSISVGNPDAAKLTYRYYWLAQAYFESSRFDESMAANLKALEYDKNNNLARWSIAGVYYNQKKWPAAIAEYTKTVELFKNDTASLKDIYYYRGRSYLENKDFSKGIADFESALRIDPSYKRANWQISSAFFQQKKYKEAIANYTTTIEKYKDDKNSLDDQYYFRGFSYLQLKDSVKAIDDFKQALKYNSNLRDPNLVMGNIMYGRGNYAEAKVYYNVAIPGYVTDSVELSKLWFKKGFSNFITAYSYTAKEDLLRSIKLDSNNREAHRYLADLYFSDKSFALTEKEMDKCIILYKNVKDSLPRMYMYRGTARSSQQKYKDALADYEQSDKLKKITDPAYLVPMAQLAFEIKDYEKTVTIFNRLLPLYKPAQNNELVFVYFGRGRAYLEMKKKQLAINDLNKSLELSPANKDITPWLTKAQAL